MSTRLAMVTTIATFISAHAYLTMLKSVDAIGEGKAEERRNKDQPLKVYKNEGEDRKGKTCEEKEQAKLENFDWQVTQQSMLA